MQNGKKAPVLSHVRLQFLIRKNTYNKTVIKRINKTNKLIINTLIQIKNYPIHYIARGYH